MTESSAQDIIIAGYYHFTFLFSNDIFLSLRICYFAIRNISKDTPGISTVTEHSLSEAPKKVR